MLGRALILCYVERLSCTVKNFKPSERTSQNLLLNMIQFSVSDTNGSSRGTQKI
jgi:hypothetical protein